MQVIFTDGSSFSVRPMKNRMHVWKHGRERVLLRNIIPTLKSWYQTESVWEGFSALGRTPLV